MSGSRRSALSGRARGPVAASSDLVPVQPVLAPDAADPIPFWRAKRLVDMTDGEWESLCDGCGNCCLVKVLDEDSGAVGYTDLACKLLDITDCRCRDYAQRQRHVPDCVRLTAGTVGALDWLPGTCAYRMIARGEDLAWWHPLLSGDPETVHLAGISARGRVVPEDTVPEDEIEDHVVAWLDP